MQRFAVVTRCGFRFPMLPRSTFKLSKVIHPVEKLNQDLLCAAISTFPHCFF